MASFWNTDRRVAFDGLIVIRHVSIRTKVKRVGRMAVDMGKEDLEQRWSGRLRGRSSTTCSNGSCCASAPFTLASHADASRPTLNPIKIGG